MTNKGAKMASEERILVSVACKNIIEPLRRVWRTIVTIETFERFEKYSAYTNEYKEEVRERYDKECQKIIDMIHRNMIDQAEEGSEGLAYFSKM